MRRRILFSVAFFLLIFAVGFIGGCATTGQPNMQTALDELQAARSELEAASSDKGGHRVAAISLVDQAIDQVREGIRYANVH
jgi:hypothetical protein